MSEIKIYDKKEMRQAVANLAPNYANPVVMAEKRIGSKYRDPSGSNYDRVFGTGSGPQRLGSTGADYSKAAVYGGAIHVPMAWADGKVESAYERVASGRFGKGVPKGAMTGNTLLPDWTQLWDAMRMDITQRKNALPTVRQLFYAVSNRPDADKTNKITEMWPYGIVFKQHNGAGQPVNQGDKGEGALGSFDVNIYAAGFRWDLLAKMFDKSLDMTALNDAVAVGYNAKLDDLAMSPILADIYSTAGTAKHTAAATTTGAGRQELLYDTIENAIDGLGVRKDPITKRLIDPRGCYLLCSGRVAGHAARVINGLPENTNNKRLGAIAEIAGIVAYDGDVIDMRDESVTYSGVGDTYAYLVKP
ncbi:MAG: hypothetical protein EHM48_08885, partial [Planctomycetaceae bacterium]